MYTFVLVMSLVLFNGETYTPPALHYPNFVSCMDTAMRVTSAYRKSDLKEYKVMCLNKTTSTGNSD